MTQYLFGSVIKIAFQNTFHSYVHQNNTHTLVYQNNSKILKIK